MGTVYIISDHGKLTKKGDALSFYSSDGTERKIFIHRTDRLIISGNVEITGSAFRMIMSHSVDTVFLSSNGRFNGKLQFEEGKNVLLRKRQYESQNDEAFKLNFAKAIAEGKLKNQIQFMLRINRKEDNTVIERTIQQAKSNLEKMLMAETIDSVRGYEGMGAKLYFSIFKKNINPEWAVFKGRSMNPPKDTVNAVLSFLYTLLLYRIDGFIEMEGLDPYVGYLHTLEYGKRGLSFDLMEEYRTSICDTLTCSLFNLGILKEEDFEKKDFSTSDDDMPLQAETADSTSEISNVGVEHAVGVLLSKEGIRKTVQQFEQKMETLIFYQPENARISYQQVIASQVDQFKRFLIGEESMYKPFVVK